ISQPAAHATATEAHIAHHAAVHAHAMRAVRTMTESATLLAHRRDCRRTTGDNEHASHDHHCSLFHPSSPTRSVFTPQPSMNGGAWGIPSQTRQRLHEMTGSKRAAVSFSVCLKSASR